MVLNNKDLLLPYATHLMAQSAYNAGDADSIPGSGRSPEESHGNPLQYSHARGQRSLSLSRGQRSLVSCIQPIQHRAGHD